MLICQFLNTVLKVNGIYKVFAGKSSGKLCPATGKSYFQIKLSAGLRTQRLWLSLDIECLPFQDRLRLGELEREFLLWIILGAPFKDISRLSQLL
jgi:hypothetical protein